jgi:hypothetical protein
MKSIRLFLALAFLVMSFNPPVGAQTSSQQQQLQRQRYQQQQLQQQRYQRQLQIQARQQRLQQLQGRQRQLLQQQQLLRYRQQQLQQQHQTAMSKAEAAASANKNLPARTTVVRRKTPTNNSLQGQQSSRLGRNRALVTLKPSSPASGTKTPIPLAKSPQVLQAKTSLRTNQLNALRARLLASTAIHKDGPTLPVSKSKTFLNGNYRNRQASGEEVFYRYHGVDNRTGNEYTFVTNTKFSSARELRDNMAILKEWGIKMDYVTTFHPPKGVWISEGVSAPQKGKNGESLPGGGYQALIETDNLHPFTVIATDRLSEDFSK